MSETKGINYKISERIWRFYDVRTQDEFVGTNKEYAKKYGITLHTLEKEVSEGFIVKTTLDGQSYFKDDQHSKPEVKKIVRKEILLRDYKINGF